MQSGLLYNSFLPRFVLTDFYCTTGFAVYPGVTHCQALFVLIVLVLGPQKLRTSYDYFIRAKH